MIPKNLTEKNGEYEGVCLNLKDIPPDDLYVGNIYGKHGLIMQLQRDGNDPYRLSTRF